MLSRSGEHMSFSKEKRVVVLGFMSASAPMQKLGSKLDSISIIRTSAFHCISWNPGNKVFEIAHKGLLCWILLPSVGMNFYQSSPSLRPGDHCQLPLLGNKELT